MTIEKAGLLDPTALLYSPAIRIDYNVHTLEQLIVRDNVATGKGGVLTFNIIESKCAVAVYILVYVTFTRGD